MVLVVATKPTGEKVIAESSEAKAWGYSYTTPSVPLGVTPQELKDISNRGGGVLQTTGSTYVVKESAEYREAQNKVAAEPVAPKLAEGTSGYYVKSSTGVYVPVSKGVADLITSNNALAARNAAATGAIAPQNRNRDVFTTTGEYKTFKMPQTYTSSTTLEEQMRSNKLFKEVSISPESVGWQRWNTMENIRLSQEYQTAFMLKKLVTGESVIAAGAGGLAALAGKYPEYQQWLQQRWLGEQRAETLQMSQFGEKMVFDKSLLMQHDINREQFIQAKALEIIPPAAMWIAPDIIGKGFAAAVTAGKLGVSAAQAWSKIGLIVTGAGVAYGTSEIYQGVSMGTPAGFEKAASGFIIGGFSAYGLKQMWAAAFPKKYQIFSYTTEYQTYSGESETLKGEFMQGYQDIQSYRYGNPAEKMPKTSISDEAIYMRIKGYKTETLFTGDTVVNEFDKSLKFRISEKEGLYKPLLQNIEEVDVFYPKFSKGETIRNLGVSYYDTGIGKPDVFKEFTFSKTGMSRTVNIAEWENSFRNISHDIPVSMRFERGTGYEIFKDEFKALIKNMVADKSIVITSAEYQSFFLETDTREPFTSFAASGKHAASWITTGDYYGYAPKQDLFDMLGIRQMPSGAGAIRMEGDKTVLVSKATLNAERLKVMQKPLYDFTYYDKPVIVMANYPPETSLTLIPPTVVGFAKGSVNYGMNFTGLKGEAGLGLKPEVKQFIQPELKMIYEPSLKELPYSKPELKPELKPEMRLEPKLQPALQPALALEPKLELEPKMEMRMQAKLEMRNEMRLQVKPELMLGYKFKEKVNIFYEEEGRDWFKVGKNGIFGIGKRDRLRKETFKIEPKSDWLSRLESEARYGRATNIPNTPKFRRMFKQEFLGSPLGMFAGRMPTMEMFKGERFVWVR
jgi:hypothetical protein